MPRVKQISIADAVAQAPQAQSVPRAMIPQLLQQGTSGAPVDNMTQGFTRLGNAGLGAYMANVEDGKRKKSAAARMADTKLLAQAMQGWVDPDTGVAANGGMAGVQRAMSQLQSPEMQQQAASMLMQDAMRKSVPGKPVTLADGAMLVDPATGKQIASNEKTFRPDVLSPEAMAQKAELAKLGAPRTTQSIKLPARENAYAGGRGENDASFINGLLDAGRKAGDTISRINRMTQLMDNIETGAGDQWKLAATRGLKGLGISVDVAGLGKREAIASMQTDFLMDQIAKMKGAISDNEGERLLMAAAGLGKTRTGNQLIRGTLRTMANRSRAVARMARDHEKKHGNGANAKGQIFDEVLAEWQEKNPLFTESLNAKIEKAMQAEPAPEQAPALEATKTIGGRQYFKIGGRWFTK